MKILVSALEHSANIHLAEVVKYLPKDTQLLGIFSCDLGEPLMDMRSLAIMGIGDALTKVPFFLKLAKDMVNLAKDCDKVLLMDSSGFNLPLAKKLKKAYPNKEIIYYILPQAWAWRKSRIDRLVKYCDRLLSILPFEKEYYPSNAPLEYVGHPLIDELKYFKLDSSKDVKTIAFLAGSRRREILSLMPYFKELQKEFRDKELLLAIPPFFSQNEISELYGDIEGFTITNNAHKALYESDFAFICSGTATLEASLIGTPFILTYIASKFDYMIAKRVLHIDKIGLANIFFSYIENRDMHPELIQDDINIQTLIKLYQEFDRDKFLDDSIKLRKYLKSGSAKRVAQIVLNN